MALVLADRVQETSTTTGTGTLTLAGAVAGFQSFSAIGNGNTTYYCITEASTGAWEVGTGTYTSSGTTLSRTTVYSSSTGSLVNFTSGALTVFCDYPASRSVTTATLASPPAIGNTTPNSLYCSDGSSQGIAYFGVGSKQLYGASTFLYNSNGVACVYSSTTNPYMGGSIYSSTVGYSFGYNYASFVGSWNGNDSVLAFNCYNDTNQLPAYSYAGQASYLITDGSSFTFNFSNGSGTAGAEFTPVSGLSITPTGITSTKVSAGSGGITSTLSIKSTSSSAGVGYATGAGSTQTQATSKSTGVTLNNICGQITTTASALAASTSVSFTLTNSSIAATDVVIVNVANVGGVAPTINTYQVGVDSVLAGSCRIHIRNVSAASASQALVLNFAVIKSVAA